MCESQKYLLYPFNSFFDALTLEIRVRVVRVSKLEESRPFTILLRLQLLSICKGLTLEVGAKGRCSVIEQDTIEETLSQIVEAWIIKHL